MIIKDEILELLRMVSSEDGVTSLSQALSQALSQVLSPVLSPVDELIVRRRIGVKLIHNMSNQDITNPPDESLRRVWPV